MGDIANFLVRRAYRDCKEQWVRSIYLLVLTVTAIALSPPIRTDTYCYTELISTHSKPPGKRQKGTSRGLARHVA
jgi:hypothetical protein